MSSSKQWSIYVIYDILFIPALEDFTCVPGEPHPQACPYTPSVANGGSVFTVLYGILDSKVHGANRGPTWDRQDPGGSQVGPMNLAKSLGCCWEGNFALSVGGSCGSTFDETSISPTVFSERKYMYLNLYKVYTGDHYVVDNLLVIRHHRIKWWLGVKYITSDYIKHWRELLTHFFANNVFLYFVWFLFVRCILGMTICETGIAMMCLTSWTYWL